jgi:type IV pilus assembly protein PilQ
MKTTLHHLLAAGLFLAVGVLAQPPLPPLPSPLPTNQLPLPSFQMPLPSNQPPLPADQPLPVVPMAPAAPDAAPNISITQEGGGPAGISVTTNASNKNLISINFEHAPLTEVIRAFTLISGANIVLGTNGHELVTLSMKDVEWEPALNAILDSTGKTLVMKTPGIYVVANKADTVSEPVAVEVVQLKYIMASTILPTVEKMLVGTNTSVGVIASANALIIKTTPSNLLGIRKTIEQVDQPRQQVFIEAKFVELNDEAIKDIGIDWQSMSGVTLGAGSLAANLTQTRTSTQSRDANSGQAEQRVHADGTINYGLDGSALVPQGPSTFPTAPLSANSKVSAGTVTPSGPAGRVTMDTITQGQTVDLAVQDASSLIANDVRTAVLTATDFNVVLSALKQNIGVAIISNPRLLVASGQEATIHVGEDRPYAKKATTQQGTGGTSTQSEIDQIKTGVQLTVTPTVNQCSNVTLRIKPRLSRVSGTVTIDGNDVPVLTTRDVDSEFNVDSGRTVAIGGLTTASDQQRVSKIPLLGDIPILGKYLFSHTHTDKVQDEVIIFVSVSVARAEKILDNEGIPSGGLLIHRYQLKEKVDAAEAQQALEAEKKRLDDAAKKAATPGRRALFE